MFVVKNLSCSFNGKNVFSNISFSLSRGEAIAILGPAESGKTVLAYCLTGIIPNRIAAEVHGEIVLDGENILGKKPGDLASKIGLVMQNYEAQLFGLTVEEDVRFALENMGLDEHEIEGRVDWALKSLGLEKYRSYRTSQLSGGLKQRLAIASVIAAKPKVVILDDPTLNLDWIGIKSLENIIARLKNEGMSFVVLSKCVDGIENVIDKTIVLGNNGWNGNAIECGEVKPHDLLTKSKVSKNMKEEELIRVENVWFKYPDTDYIIKNISLSIRRGDVVAIMGSNGSGKTTLVKLMSGILKPSKGRVVVLGKDTRKYSASDIAKHVTVVFQNPERYTVFETVFDEVYFGCRNIGLPKEFAENALRFTGLYDKMFEAPYNLSRSEKIRLHIASALAMNPDVLILDEPLTSCDLIMFSMLKSLVDYMYMQGKAVVIVTHDTNIAAKLCNRVVVLNNGVVVTDSNQSIFFNDNFVRNTGIRPLKIFNKIFVGGA